MQAKAKKTFEITFVIYLISFSIVSFFSIPYVGGLLTISLIPVMVSSFFTMRVPFNDPKPPTGFSIKTKNNTLNIIDGSMKKGVSSSNNKLQNAMTSDVKERKMSNTKLVMEATNEILGAVNEGLESFNHEMSIFNAAMKLKSEWTETLKKKRSDVKIKIALMESDLKLMSRYDDLKSKNMFGIVENNPDFKEVYNKLTQ